MTPTPEVQERLRRYLLGLLADDAREEIEKELLVSDELYQELLIVEDELVDEYLSTKLSESERAAFEKHFLTTPERQEKLRFSRAFNRYVSAQTAAVSVRKASSSPAPWARVQTLFSSPLRIAVAAIIVVGVALGVWRIFFHQSEVDKGLLALNAAYREQRPVEARISTLNYAPYVTTRGPGDQKIDQNELALAELTLRAELRKNDAPSVHHALGKVFLAKKDFDAAIEQFDEALKGDQRNAQLYSDLGAAWLEKGKIDREGKELGKGAAELARSLENLNRALELNPNLLEALFNRALSRQYQRLYSQAEADWREYLRKDPSSQWATEANQNLKVIEEAKPGETTSQQRPLDAFLSAYRNRDDQAAWNIYRHSHSPTGNTITNDLIDALLRENEAGKQSNNLGALNYAGQLQLNNAKDPYDLNLARFYGSATPQVQAVLRQAREDIKNGYELFRRSKLTDAMELFSRARKAFSTVGDDGEALLAEQAIAHAANVQPDLKQSELILARIIPICAAKNYKWLLSQCLIERAHLQSNLSNYSEAIDDSDRALDLFESIQDYNGTMAAFVQLASLHLSLNDSEQSLSFVEQGFANVAKDQTNNMQPWGMYTAAALNFDNLNLYRAAYDFQSEALSLALNSGVPVYISRSYEYLGLTYGLLQQYDEAIRNVRRAYEQGRSLATDRNGQSMMAHASLILGDLYRISGNHSQALDAYDESTRLYEGLDFGHYRYLSHKGTLLTLLAEGNDASAAQELPIVLKLFEKYREKILEERQRSFFFDKEQDVYDLAIDFAFSKGDEKRAFDYSETSRARNLLDLLVHGGLVVKREDRFDFRVPSQLAESLPLDTIRERMPDRVQILQYAVLKDRVVFWVITKSNFTARSTTIDSRTLANAIASSLRVIAEGDENQAAAELRHLYDILIKPVQDLLNPDKWLCIVPDKELNYLPFGALLSSTSGRYLVQDFSLTLSPSSSIFILCTEEAKKKDTGETERLLVVGNPSFDRDAYPQYPYLVAAQHEAEEVAALYPSSHILVKAEATVPTVKAELQRSDVAHFATHYIVDPQSTLSSRLLLAIAKGGPDRGELQARDVCKVDLSRTRLVILSACQTGIERQFRGEGPTSFARQFMIAGVPVIVASLWPVDDSEATAQLMIAFHRHRRSGVPTADALRRAQKEMIESSDARYRRPYYWAAFMTIGGYSDF